MPSLALPVEAPDWRVTAVVDKYAADIDWYRNRYGKAVGETRFFLEQSPVESVNQPNNLLMVGGASIIWQALQGLAPTYFNNANTNLGVGDGNPAAPGGGGTISVTNASTAVTFSAAQTVTAILGNYIIVAGDSSNGIYKVTTSSSTTAFTISPAYGGSTNATGTVTIVTGELPNQTDLQGTTNKVRNAADSTFPSQTDGTGALAITAATNATPIVLTTATNAYSNGQFVSVTGVLGNTAANGVWQISGVTTTSVTLNGSAGNGAFIASNSALVTQNSVLTVQSTFGTSIGNFTWYEWSLFNASSAGRMLNRKVASLGTKTSAASWAFKVGIALQ